MVQFEELLLKLQALKPEIDDLSDALGMKGMLSEIQQLELKATEPGFWDDVEKSQKVLQRTGSLKGKVEAYEGLVAKYEDTHALIELANEEEDESLLEEAESEVEAVKENLEKQRLQTLLTGEYDKNNAILTFHAGSGGTEAQDWAEMLYRMYTRWAEAHGFKVKEVDYLDGDEAGLKSAVLLVEGENAYGYLKSEAGVHRLVRVSPFDSAGYAGNCKRYRGSHSARRYQNGCLPCQRCRRSEGQQDFICCSSYSYSYWYRCCQSG